MGAMPKPGPSGSYLRAWESDRWLRGRACPQHSRIRCWSFAHHEISRPNPAFWPPVLLEVGAHVRRGGVQSSWGSRVYLPEPVPFPGTASPLVLGRRPGWHLLEPPGLGMPCFLLSAPASA